MSLSVRNIMKMTVNFVRSSRRNIIDRETLGLLSFLFAGNENGGSGVVLDAQKFFLYSSIQHRLDTNRFSLLAKEYQAHLNEVLAVEYINGRGSLDYMDTVCLAYSMTDDSFELLYELLHKDDRGARLKASHIFSFSADQRCIDALTETTPAGFVLIPAGEFVFGSTHSLDERYDKKVWLPSFYISRFPITQSAYDEDVLFLASDSNAPPCHGIDWYSAYDFAKRHKVSLPTEAQWEKAARGTDGRDYPWGNAFAPDRVNSFESGRETFTPVGKFGPESASPFGVLDCVGNCWEWTASLYGKYDEGAFLLTSDNKTMGDRVLRGGAYDFDHYGVTTTNRYRCNPENAWDTHGFRVAITL